VNFKVSTDLFERDAGCDLSVCWYRVGLPRLLRITENWGSIPEKVYEIRHLQLRLAAGA
jgi:hypothetical protein